MTMNVIKAVIFDVGKVLFRWDLRYLFEKLIADPQELDWFLDNVVTVEWHFQADAGRQLSDMREELTVVFPEHAPLIDAYTKRFNETIPGPVEGSLEIVRELDALGVPLFAITNFGAEFWAGFYPTQSIFRLFQDIIVSGNEKIVKPDPAIYQLAFRRFGLAPGEALFIDDNLANIVAAGEIGFVTHHFSNAAGLRAELERHRLLTPEKKAWA